MKTGFVSFSFFSNVFGLAARTLPVVLLLAVAGGCGGGSSTPDNSGSTNGNSGGGGDFGDNGDGGSGGDDDEENPSTNPDRCAPNPFPMDFENVSAQIGLCYESDRTEYLDYDVNSREVPESTGGIALADVFGSGLPALYVTRGGGLEGQLFTYDGTQFGEVFGRHGINPRGYEHAGYWVDINSDGRKDFISIQYDGIVETFIQEENQVFSLSDRGIAHVRPTQGLAAGDYDLDGDLDLVFAHWGGEPLEGDQLTEYLWRNTGGGHYEDESHNFGLVTNDEPEWSFTPTFADFTLDGYPDLFLAADFETTQVFVNIGGQSFENVTTPVIDDENGMGLAVGDYDRDGDLDWFVTSIWVDVGEDLPKENAGISGNRLYRNGDGQGLWEDVSEAAGVREGEWGWGACFADFDLDGYPDIFHTNGWGNTQMRSRLYMNNRDGTFSDQAQFRGIDHLDPGRGVICYDYNDDGLIDIIVGNHALSPNVFRNDFVTGNNFLKVDLVGLGENLEAVGARVAVTTPDGTQVDEVRLGTHYISQQPPTLHFGLGPYEEADRVEITWPDLAGTISIVENVPANQKVVLEQPEVSTPSLHVVGGEGSGVYEPGTEVTITALEPIEHYSFSHWSPSAEVEMEDTTSWQTTLVMPERSLSVTARYLPGIYPEDVEISEARRWNEVLLQAIRNDFARPTVHARNLFHLAAAMYDAWAVYDSTATTWLLDREQAGFECDLNVEMSTTNAEASQIKAASYAAYRLIYHRFEESPGVSSIRRNANTLMERLGYPVSEASTIVQPDRPDFLGNFIASCYIDMGLQDGSNERGSYENQHYEPVNDPLLPHEPGNPDIEDLNRWQPLTLEEAVDQSGNIVDSTPSFIGAEWGDVWPFALDMEDRDTHDRDGDTYWVYHDPGVPPKHGDELDDLYKWGFSLVSIWGSHLDHEDGETWDISPASIGNIDDYPEDFEDFEDFYDRLEGGDPGLGYEVNPFTQLPYEPQEVPRGDYARVLAEFWADGPDSETPPGHWFVILNTVNEHPELEKRFKGEGDELGAFEWDIRGYLMLGGAMHDSAISAWSNKGWYDYIRPVSAIRAMADLGQSTDDSAASYSPDGIPLEEGYIELVESGDELAGEDDEHVGKIKLFTWKGPDYIEDATEDMAGVGWILAENWWPYQRPTFVTPPFAGYVSGHSTYSRAAAETLTTLTGDRYFPGGMSGFEVKANEFLVFEEGPSVDLTLQWATYQDASDQCSLSRIWGGIHPPADDIPGRLMGIKIAESANLVAEQLFDGTYSHE